MTTEKKPKQTKTKTDNPKPTYAKLVERLQAEFAVTSYLVDGPERVKKITQKIARYHMKITQRFVRYHLKITQRFLRYHLKITHRFLRYHLKITHRFVRHHLKITQRFVRYYLIITHRFVRYHLKLTQRFVRCYLKITHRFLRNYLKITHRFLRYHLKITRRFLRYQLERNSDLYKPKQITSNTNNGLFRDKLSWGRYHGGRRPSSDDSLHSPTVIPPSALDKPSIMKRYHRRRTR